MTHIGPPDAPALAPAVRHPATTRRLPWRLSPPAAFVGVALTFVALTSAAGAPSPLFVVLQQKWGFPAWVLTIAFAIYAFTLLATLLVAGSLSDYIGRRPVLIGALVAESVAMALFVVAPNIDCIIAARALQGIATGAATSTFTAAIVELAPGHRKKLGALVSGTAPIGGLALGALVTGAAIQFTHAPSVLVFSCLTVVFLLGILIVIGTPETAPRRPGALRALLPRLSVPRSARHAFLRSMPALIASWMLAGLFLGLAPSIVHGVFHLESGLVNGVIVALAPATAAGASLISGRIGAHTTTILGGSATLLGAVIAVVGITGGWLPLLFMGAVMGGMGFGATFSGVLRAIAPLATAAQRAELFAALYLVSYLAYGVPVLVAGEGIGVLGLLHTIIAYGGATGVAAVGGLCAQRRHPHPHAH